MAAGESPKLEQVSRLCDEAHRSIDARACQIAEFSHPPDWQLSTPPGLVCVHLYYQPRGSARDAKISCSVEIHGEPVSRGDAEIAEMNVSHSA